MEAMDFVNKLIQRKPKSRLGLDGPEQVKNHPWLKDFDWDKLKSKEMESPFKPYSTGSPENMRKHFKKVVWKESKEQMTKNELLLKNSKVQKLFKGY